MGFIDQSGVPTPKYRLLKGEKRRAAAAEGIRAAYRPLFDAQEDANALTGEKLKGLVAQIAGTDDDLTARIANTFQALVKIGDFDQAGESSEETRSVERKSRRLMRRNAKSRRASSAFGRNSITTFTFIYPLTGMRRFT